MAISLRLALVLPLLAAVPLGNAAASCSNRPGTPNEVRFENASDTSITFSWRNTTGKGMNKSGSGPNYSDTPHSMFFDMYLRDANNKHLNPNKDLTGTGGYKVVYGSRSSKEFTGLAPNTRYCFSLRARTEGGTQGCISAITSNVACGTTLAAGNKGKPPPPPARAPTISLEGKPNNQVVLTCRYAQPQSALTIRVVDNALQNIYITTIAGAPIRADGSGNCNILLAGLCKAKGTLFFSLTDGRKSRTDKTGNLWSNTARLNCT